MEEQTRVLAELLPPAGARQPRRRVSLPRPRCEGPTRRGAPGYATVERSRVSEQVLSLTPPFYPWWLSQSCMI